MSMLKDCLIRISQAAKIARVTPECVRSWLKAGKSSITNYLQEARRKLGLLALDCPVSLLFWVQMG
jgi:hypothetical protein